MKVTGGNILIIDDDMDVLFSGIPLADVSVSMTINSPAAVIWAMYLVVAERQGADIGRLSGTLQNDILKEYIAQKEYIYPPRPSMRIVTDTIEFGAERTPRIFEIVLVVHRYLSCLGKLFVRRIRFQVERFVTH